MDNTIYFYKLPFVYGGITQPYFASDAARDNYLAEFGGVQVNKTGVNIKLGFNYEIELKVSVDISAMINFNFAVITYNNKKFYAYIIDSEQVNVGVSRVLCLRSALFEHTNYFEHFSNFKIKKCTLPFPTYYDRRSKFFPPTNFRYYTSRYTAHLNAKIVKGIMVYCSNNKKFISVKSLINDNIYNMATFFIPFSTVKLNGTYIAGINAYINDDFQTLLDAMSPYIIYMENSFIIMDNNENAEINPLNMDCSVISANTTFDTKFTNQYFMMGVVKTYDYSLEFDIPINPYEKADIYFFSPDNVFSFDWKDYNDGGSTAFVRFNLKFLYSPSGSHIFIEVNSTDPPNNIQSVIGTKKFYLDYPLNSGRMFAVDSANLFNSENRYYSEITKLNSNYIKDKGSAQVTAQIGAGIAELMSPYALGTNMSTGSLSLGTGNIIRGIVSAVEIDMDMNKYEDERDILAKQERVKPSKSATTNGDLAMYSEFAGEIWYDVYTPFQSDYQSFLSDATTYGVDGYFERNSLVVAEYLVNGFFYISATAVLNYPTSLTTREYSELYTVLKNGCRYKYIQ